MKYSLEFKNKINNINVPDNYIMVSFYVILLYTNVTETLIQKTIKNNNKQLKTGFGSNFNLPLKIL